MATETIKLTGVGYWMRVFPDNRDMTGYNDAYRECDGAYTLELDLDSVSEERLLDSGSQKKRGMKSGRYKMIREHKHPRFDWAGGPPRVTDKDGEAWDFEDSGSIWNGSLVEVTVDVYDAGPGKGTRLKAVKVIELADPPEREDE